MLRFTNLGPVLDSTTLIGLYGSVLPGSVPDKFFNQGLHVLGTWFIRGERLISKDHRSPVHPSISFVGVYKKFFGGQKVE